MKEPSKKQLLSWLHEYEMQIRLDRINIHNKLNQPERQPKETVWDYRKRIENAQFAQGYGEDDFILI